MLLLFGPPLAAFGWSVRHNLSGPELIRPFWLAAILAFSLSGILLVATLAMGGSTAVIYLELGVAAFGGSIFSGTTAAVIYFREQRKARESRQERPWPHRGEEED